MDVGKLEAASTEADEGYWKDAATIPGVRLKVRSMGHPLVRQAIGRAIRAAPKSAFTEDGHLADEAATDIDRIVYRDRVLLDWDGLEDAGEPFPCTTENAGRLMQTSRFMEAVRAASAEAQIEETARVEDLAKNSAAPSPQPIPEKTSASRPAGRRGGKSSGTSRPIAS